MSSHITTIYSLSIYRESIFLHNFWADSFLKEFIKLFIEICKRVHHCLWGKKISLCSAGTDEHPVDIILSIEHLCLTRSYTDLCHKRYYLFRLMRILVHIVIKVSMDMPFDTL